MAEAITSNAYRKRVAKHMADNSPLPPFGFMALLGLLSLIGMQIKNAIVLMDEINAQIGAGTPPFKAVVESGVSRLRPVSMAALTTVLGMIPLLVDPFFAAMAVTIMFGLTGACMLTLVIVPVFYAIFFKVPNPIRDRSAG